MIILGIDPGTIYTGYGIIELNNNKNRYIHSGVLSLRSKATMSLKLEVIYDELMKLIKVYKPDEFAIETAFLGKNVQSAMKIGYARGVSLLAAAHGGMTACEYSPREIKKAVVGAGGASKEQVSYMVKTILDMKKETLRFDETDSLAVAICHSIRISSSFGTKNKKNSWKAFLEQNPERIIG